MAQRTIVEISPNRYSLEDLTLDLTLLGLCVVALFYRIRVTSDLMVPSDVDHYRDIGRAQTILDHRYGDDHLYQGETSLLCCPFTLQPPERIADGFFLNCYGNFCWVPSKFHPDLNRQRTLMASTRK